MNSWAHIALIVVLAGVIYLASEWFVNAIEWLGVELKVGTLAVGTVLAAIGTALPESVVTLAAVLFSGGASGDDIGIGAALGGPLVLATIAYAAIGLLMVTRARRLRFVGDSFAEVPHQRLRIDQRWFFCIASAALLLGLLVFPAKWMLGFAFLAVYGLYLRRELSGSDEAHTSDDLEGLRIWRSDSTPKRWAIIVQVVGSLAVVIVASQLFVGQLEWAGPAVGLAPAVVALLVAPIATELPELMNAIIWVRQGKTSLALANVSGSMMVQATIPAALGLFFTPWHFSAPLIAASLATLGAIAYQLIVMRGTRFTPAWLMGTALFYVAFAVFLISGNAS